MTSNRKTTGIGILLLATLTLVIMASLLCITQKCSHQCEKSTLEYAKYTTNFINSVNTGFVFLSKPTIEWIDAPERPASYQDSFKIFLNSHWIKHLSEEQLSWLLCHELAHRILNHYPFKSFTEAQELQADALATLLLYRNGFDPKHGPRTIWTLSTLDYYPDKVSGSMPDSGQRIRNITICLPHLFKNLPPSSAQFDSIMTLAEGETDQFFFSRTLNYMIMDQVNGRALFGPGIYIIGVRDDYEHSFGSASELAFVIFHELGHINHGHPRLLQNAQCISVEQKHRMELKADIESVKLILKYGYDYQAALEFLRKINNGESYTHPSSAERIKNIKEYVDSLKPRT